MEHDIIEKSETNLVKSIDKELFERFHKFSKNSYINLNSERKHINKKNNKSEVLATGDISQSNDFNSIMQEGMATMGIKCSITRVDSLFNEIMIETIGFAPSHTIQFVDSLSVAKSKSSKYTLNAKITNKQYIQVTLSSPMGSILRQAQLILYASIFLVLLIGVLLIVQLKSMLRENHFVSFIKEYTNALAHDLKTPISGIYMSASQLASGIFEDKPESRQRYYQMCKDQSLKLLTTVDRILLIAKSEHSKIVPNKTNTELRPYIDKIVDIRRQNNFRMKSVELSTSYQTEDMTGSFDAFLLENVLNNLIDNAVKYSNDVVKIHISCELVNKKLRICVKDDGFGIAKEEQKHIFDNFERGNKVEGKGIDGFGIGLNYVNRVIKAHNGVISVKSEEGIGSEFNIEIPQI